MRPPLNDGLSDVVQKFIFNWVDTVNDNKAVVLGEWLYAFGACAALALKAQNLTDDQVKDAMQYMSKAARLVYDNTEGQVRYTSMQ